MARVFLFLAVAFPGLAQATPEVCPFDPQPFREEQPLKRLAGILEGFEKSCRPKPELQKTLQAMRAQIEEEKMIPLLQGVREILSAMGSQCLNESTQSTNELHALRLASSLASTYSANEPVPEVDGVGIALGGKVLDAFRKATQTSFAGPEWLERAAHPIEALECAVYETQKQALNCDQRIGGLGTSQKPALTDADALFQAFERVEDRSRSTEASVTAAPIRAIAGFSEKPDWQQLQKIRPATDPWFDLFVWEKAEALLQTTKENFRKSQQAGAAKAFGQLRKDYREALVSEMKKRKTALEEALLHPEKMNAVQKETAFDDHARVLLNQCLGLAGALVFGATTRQTDGLNQYKELCKPFLCADGSGIPVPDPSDFETFQCRLLQGREQTIDKVRSSFLAKKTFPRGAAFCPPESETSVLKKATEAVKTLFTH